MSDYKETNSGVIYQGRLSIPNDLRNRDWVEYKAWLAAGNIPDPVDPPTPPPTNGEIYDMVIKSNKVFKAYVLAINDGSIVPGSNMTGAQLKNAVKTRM